MEVVGIYFTMKTMYSGILNITLLPNCGTILEFNQFTNLEVLRLEL